MMLSTQVCETVVRNNVCRCFKQSSARITLPACQALKSGSQGERIKRNALLMTTPDAARHYSDDSRRDLVLSSGFLAFANHTGFLKAVDEARIQVTGVMGTSAGAITGSLYCAGYSPEEAAEELSRVAPIDMLRPSNPPWLGGLLSLEAVIERLYKVLPHTFEELNCEFAVGVVTNDGRHILVDSGPLPEAVAASAAIPFIFEPVPIPGVANSPCKDGGVVDRIGLKAWRNRRRRQLSTSAHSPPPALVHVIERSSPFSGDDDVEAAGECDVTVIRSPKSGVNFFNLGDFDSQMDRAYQRARHLIMLQSASRPV